MTKFVTPTDALVLSPQWPERPEELPAIFDAFGRIVVGVEGGEVGVAWQDDVMLLQPKWAPDMAFRAIPLLKDGFTAPFLVPESWHGRVTREVVADYFRATWQLFEREPDWGAHLPFLETTPDGDALRVRTDIPVKWPLVDPLRETAGTDDDTLLAVAPVLTGDWADFLTGWENVDGFFAAANPGPAWLTRRAAALVSPTGRLWWEIRGLRDANDGHRYEGEWGRPHAITAYLGWPAYLIAAAGQTTSCPECGRVTIQGRQYCGTPDCRSARAAARQRTSRSAPRRTSKRSIA